MEGGLSALHRQGRETRVRLSGDRLHSPEKLDEDAAESVKFERFIFE